MYSSILSGNIKDCAVVSMKYARKEAVDCSGRAIGRVMYVAGTCQHSGHVSLNGLVSAMSTDTGKASDVEVPMKCFQKHAKAGKS
jgi:hypothetical protein